MRFQKPIYVVITVLACIVLQACNQGMKTSGAKTIAISEVKSCEQKLENKNYFTDVESLSELNEARSERVVRQRIVRVNLRELKADILAGSSVLNLHLFHDQKVKVIVEKIDKSSNNQMVVSGRIENDPLSSVALAVENGVVMASIKPFDQFEYQIIYRGDGTHTIQENEVEEETESSCLAETTIDSVSTTAIDEFDHKDEKLDEVEAFATIPEIDVMIAYTPAARTAAGGDHAMRAQIEAAVANGNKAFRDSKVNLTIRLVGMLALTQNESTNYSNDLSVLKTNGDGKWDTVHTERTRLGADQVTLIGAYSVGNRTAGIGYVNSTVTRAFTIVKRTALSSMYTFSHELGHNMGLYHSDGYVSEAGNFRTIMAYGSAPRILRHSNPALYYQGFMTGTTSQNSVKILNARGSRIASLVTKKLIGNPAESVPVIPKPELPPEACTN